ncbi:hypothetical protein ALC56_08987 [Trachymyrmex septentrionalis]|uniref:Uncharacterized protein n=1 Tax=Trachymyrmex septentrionalis TaxID=34720 RepID=A0A195F9Z5_9HYME|nr:hypothetical protein ALC56_08987 [Trachymyrmex septentrionalis]
MRRRCGEKKADEKDGRGKGRERESAKRRCGREVERESRLCERRGGWKTWQRRTGTRSDEERERERERAGAEGDTHRSRLFGGEWMLASLDGPPTVLDLISP